MSDDENRLKLLVLAGNRPVDEHILHVLRSAFDLDLRSEAGEALEALRTERYDAVLAATADFLPLERGLAAQQASTLLDTIGEGVCVAGRDGRLLWANSRFKGFDRRVIDQVLERCLLTGREFPASGGPPRRTRQFGLSDGEAHYDLVCSAVANGEGKLNYVAAVVFDSTAARQAQQKIDAIHRAGRELVRLGGQTVAGLDVAQRLKFIEDRVIRYTGDLLHYDHFALRVLEERSGQLEVIASMGMPEEARRSGVLPREEGNGIAGYVAATGRSYICTDVRHDPRHRPLGLPDARSSLEVPLKLQDKVIGVLSLESHHPGNFNEQDRQFVEILAGYVVIALNTLNLLTVERHSATTEITAAVSDELAGPLNDIFVEATGLMEEYIGHDDMLKRLRHITASVEAIRRTLRQFVDSPASGLLRASTAHEDPALAGRRVLVADDEELIRQTIGHVLRRCGAKVDEAADGDEAERLIRATRYDLVLSDIKMPYRNGYEVFAAAKARDATTAVILITGFGYDPNHSIVRANPQGLSAVLLKPFKVNQLLQEVRTALAGKAVGPS